MAPAPLPQTSIASPVFERRLASDGTAYFEQGDGEPLVLIHGVGMRLEAWTPQIEALSRTHRVIVVDMPGHGHSAPLPVGSDLPVFVQWFATFLNAIGLDRVNVAGHSWGRLCPAALWRLFHAASFAWRC